MYDLCGFSRPLRRPASGSFCFVVNLGVEKSRFCCDELMPDGLTTITVESIKGIFEAYIKVIILTNKVTIILFVFTI